MIANKETGTRVDEVAAGIYRICTPLDVIPGGFTVNSYLIADDEPLLFHTGYRKIFPFTLEAIRKVVPVEKLCWIGGSHFEGDEFGALNDFLTAAPEATPFGSEIGVLTSRKPLDGLLSLHTERHCAVCVASSWSTRTLELVATRHAVDFSNTLPSTGDSCRRPYAHRPPITCRLG